jgi:FKBP-type peptidyl-prolyl cis-trans isomerase FkpA
VKKLFLSLAFALLAVGCGSSGGDDGGTDFIPTDPSQVDIQFSATELVTGTGAEVFLGRTVNTNFELWLFDPNGPDGKGVRKQGSNDPGVGSISFTVGVGQVVSGYDQGVIGMKVGGKRRIYVPWQFGYGAAGSQAGGIPPYAALVFEVELLEVK